MLTDLFRNGNEVVEEMWDDKESKKKIINTVMLKFQVLYEEFFIFQGANLLPFVFYFSV